MEHAAHIEPWSRPRPPRLSIPSDLAATSDDVLRAVVSSWMARDGKVTFADVIGHTAQVEALRRLSVLLDMAVTAPARLERLGINPSLAGAVLCGPSGVGKTMLARALATASGGRRVAILPTAELTPASLGRIWAILAEEPTIAVVDEAERIIGKYQHLGADDELRVAFLSVIDGAAGGAAGGGACVVALTTLDLDQIAVACLRPGRLAPALVLSEPSLSDRRRMLERELSRRPCEPVDVSRLADRTNGWSGAEISGLVEEAAIRALVDGREAVAMADLELVAAERFRLVDEAASRAPQMRDSEHESGHTAHWALTHGIASVIEVRLTPEGGHTITVHDPSEELAPSAKMSLTRDELWSDLVGALCGGAAETVISGSLSTGADHDRAVATRIAGAILGLDSPLHVNALEHAVGEYPTGADRMREDRWRQVDALLAEAEREALAFVTERAEAIRSFAMALFESEGQRLVGTELAEALRSAFAIE